MTLRKATAVAALTLVAPLCAAVHGGAAELGPDLLRENLRQQSAAERAGCSGIQRAIGAGTDPLLVVRTAVEIGYNSCQVIRCGLERTATPDTLDQQALCEKVIRGAVAAGVPSDVIARCSENSCDPSTVAAILAATPLEPNYCYFAPRAVAAPAPLPPPEPVFERSLPRPQASPFGF